MGHDGAWCEWQAQQKDAKGRKEHLHDKGLSENRVYSQWNSHLIGIMISKTIGKMGYTIFRHTHNDSIKTQPCIWKSIYKAGVNYTSQCHRLPQSSRRPSDESIRWQVDVGVLTWRGKNIFQVTGVFFVHSKGIFPGTLRGVQWEYNRGSMGVQKTAELCRSEKSPAHAMSASSEIKLLLLYLVLRINWSDRFCNPPPSA